MPAEHELEDEDDGNLDDNDQKWSPGVRTPERMEAISDGVIAIAATLLILNIKPPEAGQPVGQSLLHEWHTLASYAVSFLVIGVVWVHHHNLFHHVREVDKMLVYLNLGMLLMIAFLPVPTATIASHLEREQFRIGEDGPSAAIFYSLSVFLVWMWFVLFWSHLIRHPHLMYPESRPYASRMRTRSAVGLVAYACSITVAVFWPAGCLMMNAVIVLYFIFRPSVPGIHAARFVGSPRLRAFGRRERAARRGLDREQAGVDEDPV